MPVPTSVKQLLEYQNVNYKVADISAKAPDKNAFHDQHLSHTGAAKSMLLQDLQGRIQVLIPANCLLDLASLNRQLNRELRAITDSQLRSFFDQHDLESIPALPKLAGLPTVVDRRLLEPESLLLDAGINNRLLELTQNDFQQILSDAYIADITAPLDNLIQNNNDLDDESMISAALNNFTGLRIKQRLEETLELPPLSETAQRIINLRIDPNSDISDLANIVEIDPSLAAQTVSWAASPYYSAPGKIKSIHDAIVRVLGFDMVLNLSLGLALGKTLNMPKDCVQGTTSYWHKAVYTAATVEALVSAIDKEHRPSFGLAYLAGLLHNFGYLILAEVFPPYFNLINRYIETNSHVHHQAIERHLINITREQLAGWLMDLWNIPAEVVTALRYQNDPDYSGQHHEYAKLIYLAQLLLRQQGIGTGPCIEAPPNLFKALHLDPSQVNMAMESIMQSSTELNNIASQLGG